MGSVTGTGFFQVQTPSGTIAYTRAGNFQLNNQGQLVDVNGNLLIPTITVPSNATSLTITQYGVVNATLPGQTNPAQLGQIQLAIFTNPGGLLRRGRGADLRVQIAGQQQGCQQRAAKRPKIFSTRHG